MIGTGPDGQLYEVRDHLREVAPIARLDHGQILSMLDEPKGGLLLGAGNPGAVTRLAAGSVPSGSLTSDVHDAKLVARFGAVRWKAETPQGAALTVQLRTGNVGEPDATWSDWSPPLDDPSTARAKVPAGRFVQFRANLKATDAAASPELRSIAIRYQTINLSPEIAKIDVPDLAEGDGATRQTKLTLKWAATDPNDDDLEYTVAVRKEGWPGWVKLGGDAPLTEKTYAWDSTAFPSGQYQVKVTAGDRPSNAPGEASTRVKSERAVRDRPRRAGRHDRRGEGRGDRAGEGRPDADRQGRRLARRRRMVAPLPGRRPLRRVERDAQNRPARPESRPACADDSSGRRGGEHGHGRRAAAGAVVRVD